MAVKLKDDIHTAQNILDNTGYEHTSHFEVKTL